MSDIDVCAAMTSSSPLPVMRLPPWTSGAARDRPESSYPAPRRARRADPARARFERRAKMRPHTEGASAMAYRVTFIPGDGVGPELSEATRRVLEGTGVEFEWDVQEAGADVMDKYGTPLPEPVLESIRKNKVAIKGPITTPIGTGFRSVNVALRAELDLYACLRPCKFYPGIPGAFPGTDVTIVRENTEDLYAGIEYEEGTPDAKKVIDFLIGKDVAVFEATHGSAPKYKGQNKVNPMAMMFSGVLMLRYLNEGQAADSLENALAEVIKEGKSVTYDLKERRDDPTAVGTSQVADAVIEKMEHAS